MRYASVFLFFAFIVASLAGCGQTGPLYMPTEEPPAAQSTAPAATTPGAEQPRTAP